MIKYFKNLVLVVFMNKFVKFEKLGESKVKFVFNEDLIIKMANECYLSDPKELYMTKVSLIKNLEESKSFALVTIPLVFAPIIIERALHDDVYTIMIASLIIYIFIALLTINVTKTIQYCKIYLKIIEDYENGDIFIEEVQEVNTRVKFKNRMK